MTRRRVDYGSLAGMAAAFAGIVGGLLLEGGELRDITQLTAALIVLGGTFGAVLISSPLPIVRGALAQLGEVVYPLQHDPAALMETIIQLATKARRNGLVSLEEDALAAADPFLGKALNLAVDGTDLQEIRRMLELDMTIEEQRSEAEARVWESAGGFAPTIGIIGAVLGLIQVMKNLADIDAVGHGIAVAFVATVYGVAAANLLFLPAAAKIKTRTRMEMQRKELIVEGVAGIIEGMNPKLIQSKLEAFAVGRAPADPRAKAAPGNARLPADAKP